MPFVDDSLDDDAAVEGSTGANQLDCHDGQDKLEDPDGDTLRILLSTDNHLGFEENDDVRGKYHWSLFFMAL